MLGTASVQQDQDAFLANAEAIASRIAGGHAGTLAALVVRPGVEVRSTGDLAIRTDWSLPTATAVRATAPHAGDTSLTLRAGGQLTLAYGVSSGFAPASDFDPTPIASSDRGGSIRAVGGADLASSDLLATTVITNTAATGDVVIGSAAASSFDPAPAVSVRTTTGTIDVRAARDIRFVNNGATVYSTGATVPVSINLTPLTFDLVSGDTGPLSPFLSGGGSVSFGAGRDVVGAAANPRRPYVTNWWWRNKGDNPAWYSRYDLFDQGIAAFGGGDVSVRAGRDLLNVGAAAPSNGFVETVDGIGVARRFGGGAVVAEAGRDLVNGLYFAGGDALQIATGGALRYAPVSAVGVPSGNPGVQLVYENTAVQVQAQGDITLASVRNAGATAPVQRNQGANGSLAVITGLGDRATLQVTTKAGDIDYLAASQPRAAGENFPDAQNGGVNVRQVIPPTAAFRAPSGSITIENPLVLAPTRGGSLDVLAAADVNFAGARFLATRNDLAAVNVVEYSGVDEALRLREPGQPGSLDASERDPLRLVAETGNVSMSQNIKSVRPFRVIAGGDIVLGQLVSVQHQPTRTDPITGTVVALSELSFLQAGRDIVNTSNNSGIEVAGPGDLLLLAGRNVDLGQGNGINSLGNTRNGTALPVGAAQVTVVAGVHADGHDYRQAASTGFGVLGASGLHRHTGDLYTLLTSPTGAVAPPLGSAAAAAFDALPVADQLAQVASLLGNARYEAAVAAFVRARPNGAALSPADAVAAFATLPDAERGAAVTRMLGAALGDVSAPLRTDFIARAAADGDAALRDAFVAYVNRVAPPSSAAATSVADAVARFDALPVERQAVWLNQVLIGELRAAGREAAAASGSDRDAAYARGYRAIETLFPVDDSVQGRTLGDIRLPTSQIRTSQRGNITLLAPGGGVNAGELVGSTTKKPADLGIVTVAGGDISAVVKNDFAVNQSRVFSLQQGDILLWASLGNIDAGRGAKTVTGAPAPVLRLDSEGRVVFDTSGSFSGSGIAVLDAGSNLDLYAPNGEINAGEAGIKSLGNAFFGAVRFVGADNLSVGGASVGAPPVASSVGATAGLAATAQSVSASTQNAGNEESEEERRRRRRARRTLLLDFLGFGEKS